MPVLALDTDALADTLDSFASTGETLEPTLVRVDLRSTSTVDARAHHALAHVPAFTLAVGAADTAVADAFDLTVDDDADAARVERAYERAPSAAVAAALLVRDAPADVWAGLVAESTTYSMLQGGPEFARWLEARGPAQPAGDAAPRVRVERAGAVTEVVLTRPARHNALDMRMREELLAALLGVRDSTGPIVVRADGPSFCSGGDLDEFGTFADPVSAHLIRLTRSPARAFHELADRLVVGLHGACLGAGIELPAFAAHVVAADDARIGLPELGLGLVPGAGGTVSIPRRCGRARLLDLLLRDGTIPAAEAAAWGLVDEVVPRADLERRLLEITEEMA